MSANVSRKDGIVTAPNGLTPEEDAMICSFFDEATDYDVQEIVTRQREIKILKRTCLIKLILFPATYILSFLLLPREFSKEVLKITKVYYNFLRGKISLEDFRQKALQLENNG